jgi:nitrogen regulatory protein PII
MKQLEGAIKTFHPDRVKTSLAQLGVTEMVVSEVQGLARPASSGAGLSTPDFLPRVQVKILAGDHIAEQAAAVLARAF